MHRRAQEPVKKRRAENTPPTIRTTAELARHVGLSRATVSRILNGHSGIKPKNVDRVMDVVQRTGFTQNPYSNMLREQRSGTIAVCLSDFKHHALVTKLARVVQLVARAGYTALIETASTTDHVRIIRWAMRMRAEAVIFVGQQSGEGLSAHVPELIAAEIPHVFTDTFEAAEANVVTVDRADALEQVGNHLVDLGHRRFGLIGIDASKAAVESARLQGLRRALQARGIDPDQAVVSLADPPSRESNMLHGREVATRFAAEKDRPTAFVALNDEMAFGAIEGFRMGGLSVPRDVAVVGFNNEDISRVASPSITTVDAEIESSSAAAVTFLIRQLQSGKVTTAHRQLLPARLIIRESTRPARV